MEQTTPDILRPKVLLWAMFALGIAVLGFWIETGIYLSAGYYGYRGLAVDIAWVVTGISVLLAIAVALVARFRSNHEMVAFAILVLPLAYLWAGLVMFLSLYSIFSTLLN